MTHAGRYSIPATTKGKRFHPLAIKARGCTALKGGRTREESKKIEREKQKKRRDREEERTKGGGS
jgi:hypothetical protein